MSDSELSDSSKTFTDITTSLQRISECPVCLEVLKCPFTLCTNKHSVCNTCAENLEKCPTCQAPLSLENFVIPGFVKDLLEALPRFCNNSGNGCRKILKQNDDHENFCGYREFECNQVGCLSKLPLSKLSEHFKENHPKLFIMKSESQSLDWHDFDPKDDRLSTQPVYLHDNWFFIRLENDIELKCLKVTFEVIPNVKLVCDFFVTVKFEKGDFSYCYTLKAAETVPLHKKNVIGNVERKTDESSTERSHESKDSAGVEEKNCMEIPQSALKHFVNDKRALEFKLKVFKTLKDD